MAPDEGTHFRATVEYDGSDFSGFQRQPGARTVQGEIEAVLARLQGGAPTTARGAGRTDAGVHATGQVIDFRLRWNSDAEALRQALNGLLPDDVAARGLSPAAPGFHPRYDATSRKYVYTIYNGPTRAPRWRRLALHEPRPLDEGAMDQAARLLLGTHDFASFGRATTPSEQTVRTLLGAEVRREGAWLRVALEANGFLFRMVRSLVGSLLVIGRGAQPPEWMGELLAARDRGAAAAVVPPQGLCLVAVRYPKTLERRDATI